MANDKPPHRPVAGNYIGTPYDVFDRTVYRSASLRAKAVLAAIQRSFNGFNNGRIGVSRDEIAERIGNANHAANRKALAELIDRGLLTIERTHPKGSRLSTEYRLTYLGTGNHKKPIPPTQEYLTWQPHGPRTKRQQPTPSVKKSRKAIEPGNVPSGAMVEQERKLSGSAIEPQHVQIGQSSGSIIEQLICYQGGEAEAKPRVTTELSPPSATDEIGRPTAITGDRWILAGRNAERNPAGPDAGELRERVDNHIRRYGWGSQGRLAFAAGIVEATFSKFKNGEIDLPNRMRVQLACAFAKAAAQEVQRKPLPVMQGKGGA